MALTNQTSIFEAKQKLPEDELSIANPVHAEVSFLITKKSEPNKKRREALRTDGKSQHSA